MRKGIAELISSSLKLKGRVCEGRVRVDFMMVIVTSEGRGGK